MLNAAKGFFVAVLAAGLWAVGADGPPHHVEGHQAAGRPHPAGTGAGTAAPDPLYPAAPDPAQPALRHHLAGAAGPGLHPGQLPVCHLPARPDEAGPAREPDRGGFPPLSGPRDSVPGRVLAHLAAGTRTAGCRRRTGRESRRGQRRADRCPDGELSAPASRGSSGSSTTCSTVAGTTTSRLSHG